MTKHWKCPHCAEEKESEDNIVMFLCPACQISMNEIKTDLIIKQKCLRCDKRDALKDGSDEGEYYCESCIEDRNKIDKNLIKIIEEKQKKVEEKRKEVEW